MGENLLLTEREMSICLYCISWFEADENKFMEGIKTLFDTIHKRMEKELPHLSELEIDEEVLDLINLGFNLLDSNFEWDIIGYFETMEDYYKASIDYGRK